MSDFEHLALLLLLRTVPRRFHPNISGSHRDVVYSPQYDGSTYERSGSGSPGILNFTHGRQRKPRSERYTSLSSIGITHDQSPRALHFHTQGRTASFGKIFTSDLSSVPRCHHFARGANGRPTYIERTRCYHPPRSSTRTSSERR